MRENMKRKPWILFVIAVLVVTFTGCDQDNAGSFDTEESLTDSTFDQLWEEDFAEQSDNPETTHQDDQKKKYSPKDFWSLLKEEEKQTFLSYEFSFSDRRSDLDFEVRYSQKNVMTETDGKTRPVMKISYPCVVYNNYGYLAYISKINESCKSAARKFMTENNEQAQQYDIPEKTENAFSYDSKAYLQRLDESVCSMLEVVQLHVPEQSDTVTLRAYNYDVHTSEKIRLEDLVEDTDEFRDEVMQAFSDKYGVIFDASDISRLWSEEADEEGGMVFTIESDRVSCWMIDSSLQDTEGDHQIMTVEIPKTGKFFNKSYMPRVKTIVPGVEYTTTSGRSLIISEDLTADKENRKRNKVMIKDGTQNITMMDAERFVRENVYLINNGREYLYMDLIMDDTGNDRMLGVYDFRQTKASQMYVQEYDFALKAAIVSPERFNVRFRKNLEDAIFSLVACRVNYSGELEVLDFDSSAVASKGIVLKKDLEVEVLDENTDSLVSERSSIFDAETIVINVNLKGRPEVLTAGTRLGYLFTFPYEEWEMYAFTKDERMVRIRISQDKYNFMIDHIPVDEVMEIAK